MSALVELVAIAAWLTGLVVALVLVARLVMRPVLGSTFVYALWLLPPVVCLTMLVVPRPAASRILLSEAPLTPTSADMTGALIGVWLTGCAVMLAWQLLRQTSTRSRTKTVHLYRVGNIEFVSSAEQVTPLARGLFRKQVVLPDGFDRLFTPRQRLLIVNHEMAHHQRHDIAANAVAQALRCVFWFHPLLHIAYRYFRNDQELATDAHVLRDAPQADRRAYGEALLHAAEQSSVASVGWSGSKRLLTQRIRNLSEKANSPRTQRAGVAVLFTLIALTAFTGWQAVPPQLTVFLSTAEAAAVLPSLSSDELTQNVMFAVKHGDDRLLDQLLSRRAGTSYTLPGEGTPLIVAARQGDLKAVKKLVAHGADVNAAVLTAGSPLIMAAKHNHVAVAQFLIDTGSDVNAHVFLDETPLINAARFGHAEMAQTLIAAGADTEKSVTTFSITHLPLGTKSPMSEAKRLNHQHIVELLNSH